MKKKQNKKPTHEMTSEEYDKKKKQELRGRGCSGCDTDIYKLNHNCPTHMKTWQDMYGSMIPWDNKQRH